MNSIFKVAQKIGEEESMVNGLPLRVQNVAGSYLFEKKDQDAEAIDIFADRQATWFESRAARVFVVDLEVSADDRTIQ